MKVVGFIGPSGTGKSHRASWVARERGIDYIIDDGLLIKGTAIIAGYSAKREVTRIASIKRAIFTDATHAESVRDAIFSHNIKKILILGTSDGMVDTIAKILDLPKVAERIYITDVASKEEMEDALRTRKEQGKHVVPVPTLELKNHFSGYFLDPLQIFRRRGRGKYQLVGEKSVVRPTFTYLGKYTISDYTIYQIADHILNKIEGIYKISRFRVENQPDGIYMEMDIVLVYGYDIKKLLIEARDKIREGIEYLTALNIKTCKIVAKSLVLDDNKKND